MHCLIYRTVKYKDDGRDLVTGWDFVTIHVTFPFINAWVSYQIVYVAIVAFCALCPDAGSSVSEHDWYFCKNYVVTNNEELFYYFLTAQISKALFFLIFVEMSIYLTYYKDIMFALVTLIDYVGMYVICRSTIKQENFGSDTPNDVKLAKRTNQLNGWLEAMMILNCIWLAVTLITDFDSAFYRKASVYKRRVDKAAARKKAEIVASKQVEDDAPSSSRKGSLFGTIVESSSARDREDEKIRSNSFHQFMMFENL